MKTIFIPIVLLLALGLPALARDPSPTPGGGTGGLRGAPGPLVGAGLPVLLVGGGIYWLVKRRRKGS